MATLGRIAWIYVAAHATAGYAAEPAWIGVPMHYVARNSQLPDVLKDVASAGGMKLFAARDVKGVVNGTFDELPARVFMTLTEAYGLTWYFDGTTIYVSSGADVKNRTLPFSPMTREAVVSLLSGLGLDDSHLPVRYSDTTATISGPSKFIDAVADAIDKARQQIVVETPFDQTEIRVFPLRFAQAQDTTYTTGNHDETIPGVASLLRSLMADVYVPAREKTTPRDRARPARGGPPPLPGLRGLGLADTSSTDDTPTDTDSGKTRMTPARRNIIADARTNSVVVYDLPSMMPTYEHALAMLDRPQDLVEITAAVIDISSDAAQELGVRWGGGVSGRNGSGFATMNALSQDSSSGSSVLSSTTPGLNLATLIGNSAQYLFAQIHVLEETGKARILSRPQVLTLNNRQAVLASHNSMYVRVAGNQDVDLFNVDTGLTLKVTPTVQKDGASHSNVLLNVQIEDGAFDNNATVDGIPRANNHSIITQAVVADGESLLIGGYEYEHSETNTSKVPVLGDLPYIGGLFSDRQTALQRLERLILITPRIKPIAGSVQRAAVPITPIAPIATDPPLPMQYPLDGPRHRVPLPVDLPPGMAPARERFR